MNVVRGTRVCIHSVRTSVVTTHMSACTCRYLLVVRTTDRKGAPEPHAAVCQTGRRNGRKEGRKVARQAGRQVEKQGEARRKFRYIAFVSAKRNGSDAWPSNARSSKSFITAMFRDAVPRIINPRNFWKRPKLPAESLNILQYEPGNSQQRSFSATAERNDRT